MKIKVNKIAVLVLVILAVLGITSYIFSDVLVSQIGKVITPIEIPCSMKGTLPYEVAMIRGAVVKIRLEGVGSGSGVFIRPDLILTAGHVIDMANLSGYYHWLDNVDSEYEHKCVEFTIICDDGTKLVSREYYRESNNVDIGFLVVDPNHGLDIPAIMFSNDVLVGETVFTVGSPLGDLFNSVTSGVISALDRRGFTLWDSPLIQTDTPVNPGNSGGPLFNMKGEIVGIVVGGYSGGDGLGLCVHSKVIYWSLRRFDATIGLERVIGK